MQSRLGTAKSITACLVAAMSLPMAMPGLAQTVAPVDRPPLHLLPLPERIVGRVSQAGDMIWRQWPGTYFETAFAGPSAFFRVGEGDVSLRVVLDAGEPLSLIKPAPGLYAISGIGAGPHRLRVQIVSESQGGPTGFGGFLAPKGTVPAPLPARSRAIEFVGDSHTVGYGNTSPTQSCTSDEVWRTTDTSRGIGADVAAHYDADYQVNAISGRGVVRNYNNGPGDTLPRAYPFTLFDRAEPARDQGWHPQVVVVALGTNDFSTPLKPGEPWATRDALHADYEAGYVRFLGQLRARYPQAYLLLWATDIGGAEIGDEVGKVVDQVRASGESRVGFVLVPGLAFSACNHHPGLADDQVIAAALIRDIDAQKVFSSLPAAGSATSPQG